ncbi:uncharacterized protein TNCV_2090841 [Trichonephila clavipes]|nr:uncharacterized protein TNCV_2090841 [Trichonephila clavipes]
MSQNCLRTVTTFLWPARSPDLSPIEHIWDHLGRRVEHPTSLNELEARLHSPPGDATLYQLLLRSIFCQVASRITKIDANLALPPTFRHVSIEISLERPGFDARCHQIPSECTRSTCSLNQWVRSLVGLFTSAGTGEYFPPLQFTCRNCGGGDRGRVAIYRPFGEVSLSLNRTVTCMVLKANDRRTSCPCHDEFRGPRSDYVRQVALATTTKNEANQEL